MGGSQGKAWADRSSMVGDNVSMFSPRLPVSWQGKHGTREWRYRDICGESTRKEARPRGG